MEEPSTIVFTYTGRGSAVYENIFKPFTDYLGKCTAKKIVYYPVQSNSAEIEAMRSGRLHVAGFSTGPTGFASTWPAPSRSRSRAPRVSGLQPHRDRRRIAVSEAFRSQGQEGRAHVAVVEFGKPGAARVVPWRRSRARQGLQARVLRQARPVRARRSGDYDAAPVASDVFIRMAHRGQIG
jgi:phosphonate transport system substrate-binding protein